MATKTIINLGDEAQDPITGYKGVCICRTERISGCTRIGLQAAMGKDGKVPHPQHYDEPMLKLLKAGKFAATSKDTGGPRPAPVSAPAAKR